jgi:hypothetical protein
MEEEEDHDHGVMMTKKKMRRMRRMIMLVMMMMTMTRWRCVWPGCCRASATWRRASSSRRAWAPGGCAPSRHTRKPPPGPLAFFVRTERQLIIHRPISYCSELRCLYLMAGGAPARPGPLTVRRPMTWCYIHGMRG